MNNIQHIPHSKKSIPPSTPQLSTLPVANNATKNEEVFKEGVTDHLQNLQKGLGHNQKPKADSPKVQTPPQKQSSEGTGDYLKGGISIISGLIPGVETVQHLRHREFEKAAVSGGVDLLSLVGIGLAAKGIKVLKGVAGAKKILRVLGPILERSGIGRKIGAVTDEILTKGNRILKDIENLKGVKEIDRVTNFSQKEIEQGVKRKVTQANIRE
jgi:hypothetical protein